MRLPIALFLFFISVFRGVAQGPDPYAVVGDSAASVSAMVVDIVTGEVIDEVNADTRLCPASVWKVATTVAAVDILGADFKFRTLLGFMGKLSGGVLHGDLILVGGGDPSLASRHFDHDAESMLNRWVEAVKSAGIDSVTGRVRVNTAHFLGATLPRTRIWEDMGNYYGTGASGFNFNDNTYFVSFHVPDQPGDTARITEVYPEVPNLQISSEVLASTIQSDRAFIFGSPLDTKRIVRGTLPAENSRYTIKGALPDPGLFAAFHFHRALREAGIGVAGGYAVENIPLEPAVYTVLDEVQSPRLAELARHINVESDNLFAETLLLQLGAHRGKPTVEGGLEVLDDYYRTICQTRYPYFAYDGSGLSRFTAISARQLIQILRHARLDPHLREEVLTGLPLAGREGGMKWFASRTNLAGNLRAKSGSMEKVRAYAGYFTTYTGRELAFAVMVNNFQGSGLDVRKDIENYLLRIYGDR